MDFSKTIVSENEANFFELKYEKPCEWWEENKKKAAMGGIALLGLVIVGRLIIRAGARSRRKAQGSAS